MISNQKKLFVDDDPAVLASYRAFCKAYRLGTAEGPVRGQIVKAMEMLAAALALDPNYEPAKRLAASMRK